MLGSGSSVGLVAVVKLRRLLFDWAVLRQKEMTNTNADSGRWMRFILLVVHRWAVGILIALPLIQGLPALANDSAALPQLKEEDTPATYTSLKRFPQNLGGNFLALFSNKNVVPLLIGGAASGIVAPFDHDIRDRVGMDGQSSAVGRFGSVLGGGAV
jgi:hypothetical protein